MFKLLNKINFLIKFKIFKKSFLKKKLRNICVQNICLKKDSNPSCSNYNYLIYVNSLSDKFYKFLDNNKN